MNLYNAISMRKSVREFEKKEIEEKDIQCLERFTRELTPVFPEISYEIVFHGMEEQQQKKRGIFSAAAPCYLSYVAEDSWMSRVNAGYMMEQIVLFLTCRGIATCYQGNVKFLEAGESEKKELVVAALGYPVHYIYREEGTAKRIPLAKQCLFKEEPNKNVMTILRAANLAPSAYNGQPWRFIAYNNRIHVMVQKENVLVAKPGTKRMVDIGIALAHMAITADELWLDIEWKVLENVQSQNLKRNNYVITMLMK